MPTQQVTPRTSKARLAAAQHILASIFASQKALRSLAPEYRWAGLGNLLGDFGELVATAHYRLAKAASGSGNFDATTRDGRTVQIKTNHSATMVGVRGHSDLLLVIKVGEDGGWDEIYFGPWKPALAISRYSARDNKRTIAISQLRALAVAASTGHKRIRSTSI